MTQAPQPATALDTLVKSGFAQAAQRLADAASLLQGGKPDATLTAVVDLILASQQARLSAAAGRIVGRLQGTILNITR